MGSASTASSRAAAGGSERAPWPGGPSLRRRLAAYLRSRIPGAEGLRVGAARWLPGGFSWLVFDCEVTWRKNGRRDGTRLIVRVAPPGGVLEPYDPSREFRILEALTRAGLPVARPLWLEAGTETLGTPFYVMEYVPGEVLVPWDRALARDERRRERVRREVVEMLARLHNFDWQAAGLASLGVPPPGTGSAAREIDEFERRLATAAQVPYPAAAEVIAWLRPRMPASERTSLVHGDYRLGNFIWRDDRIVAILDWEMAFLGDPMADVAWLRSILSGWCTMNEEAAALYEKLTGLRVDPEHVRFWLVLDWLKAAMVGPSGLKAVAEGRGNDLRLLSLGRMSHLQLVRLPETLRL